MAERKPQPRVAVTIRIPADIHKRLDDLREETGVPMQRSVVDALREYLAKKRSA